MAESVNLTRGKSVEDKANCSPFDLGVLFKNYINSPTNESVNWSTRFGALEAVLLSPRQKRAAEIHDLIHLGFRISPGSFIQDIWMGLSAFHVLFFAKQCGRNSAKLDELVKSLLTFWTTTFHRLSNHSNGKCSTHNFSVIAMNNFVRVMKEEVVPVDQQLNTIVQQQIAKNRTIMASFV